LQQRICKLRQKSAVAVIIRIISVQAVLRGLLFPRQPLCRIQKRCTASAAALVSGTVHPGKKIGRERAAHDALSVIPGGIARGVVFHELIFPVVCGDVAPPLAKGASPLPVHFSVPISAPLVMSNSDRPSAGRSSTRPTSRSSPGDHKDSHGVLTGSADLLDAMLTALREKRSCPPLLLAFSIESWQYWRTEDFYDQIRKRCPASNHKR